MQVVPGFATNSSKLSYFVFLVLALSYGTGVVKDVAISDDYGFLNRDDGMARVLNADGRFVASALLELIYFLFGVENVLSVLRIVSFLGILASALLIGFWVDNLSKSNSTHKASTLSFLIPGFMVYAQVAYGFTLSLGLLLSVIGGILFCNKGVVSWLYGAIFVLLAFAAYQPAAVFCANLFFLNYVFNLSNEKALKFLIRQLSVVALIGISYLAFASSFFQITKTVKKDRFRLLDPTEISEKLEWFVTRPLVLLHLPFTLRSPSILEIALFATPTIISVYLFVKVFSGASFNKVSIKICAALCMCQIYVLSPLLVTTENQVEPRFLAPAQWLPSFILIWLIVEKGNSVLIRSRLFSKHMGPKELSQALVLLICLIFVVSSNYRYFHLIATPYERKISFLKYELSQCTDKKLILIVKRSSWPSRNLLGVWSQVSDLQSEWVPVQAVQSVLGEIQDIKVLLVESGGMMKRIDLGACFLDLEKY